MLFERRFHVTHFVYPQSTVGELASVAATIHVTAYSLYT
jgi:hypothetical protein